MLKLMGKKIFTILHTKFCLSKPVALYNNKSPLTIEQHISPFHHQDLTREIREDC